MRVHPYAGATREAYVNGSNDPDTETLRMSTAWFQNQLLLLVEELAVLSEKQENLLRHLREVPEDGITYEECRREAGAIHRICLELMQQINSFHESLPRSTRASVEITPCSRSGRSARKAM